MLDSKKRFSKTIKYYDLYRPSYPHTLINWIQRHTKLKSGSTIVDIGCGTGISTRLFTHQGFKVIGIDPNLAMLKVAHRQKGATYQAGEATHTGLATNSTDLITIAQALHWLDIHPTLQEFKRILKPNGHCCAFWNTRNPKTEFIRAYNMLILQHSQEYSKTPKPTENVQKIRLSPLVKSLIEKRFVNSQTFDLQGIIGRAYSTSYIAHGVKHHAKFKQELTNLFHKHKHNDQVTFHYHTFAVCWKFK